jgi:hypothetical protein
MCADIHDGREHKRSFKGRIQKRKTNHLQIIKSSLQRTAGPYKRAMNGLMQRNKTRAKIIFYSITSSARASRVGGTSSPSAVAVFMLRTSSSLVA